MWEDFGVKGCFIFCPVISYPDLGGSYFLLVPDRGLAQGSAALLSNVSLTQLLYVVLGRKVYIHVGPRPGVLVIPHVCPSLCVRMGFSYPAPLK